MKIIPVILSGGSGTRLWPVSRAQYPKQLIPLMGEASLLQQTAERVTGLASDGEMIIVSNQANRFQVAEQLQQVGVKSPKIMLEPVGRNTAPAIALAALEALATDENSVLLVLPSDHLIKDVSAFEAAVSQGLSHAESGKLITFGIQPTQPATGYGYIKANGDGITEIAAFTEKPDQATAESFLAEGSYYWNSGMFMFKAETYLKALQEFEPEMLAVCNQAHAEITRDLDFMRVSEDIFSQCPSNSIDYAVMERAKGAMVVPMAAGWSDLGSWEALWDAADKDSNENLVSGDVILHDVKNSYVHAANRLVGLVGVSDHIVVETTDAVMVAHKSQSENIKALVKQLEASGREEAALHRKVYRPWGSYETIDEDERFKVKRITVRPGARLSLQMHHHRAEHWIVVKGSAKVTCGEKEFLVAENESTYIPLGEKHRLENPGSIDLELIEVQSGSYLGEDDIVRLEDNYGRI